MRLAYRTRIRPILLVGVVFTVGEAFLACGSLNDVHVNVTDAPGGIGGSAGASVSSAGHSGNAAGGAGGTHANSADGGQAGEGEAGAAAGFGGVGGSGEAGGRGGSGGASGAGGGGVAGQGGAAGHGGSGGAGGGGAGGTGGACNAVVQVGALVTPTLGVGNIPSLVRSTIPVGTYVLTSEVWYGRGAPMATDAYRATLAVTTVTMNGAVTIVIQALDTMGTTDSRFTMNINTTAAPPNGIQIACSTDPNTPLNVDVQVDYSATATTLKLAFGTNTLDVFTKQ